MPESITLQVRGPFATELTVLANEFNDGTKNTNQLDVLRKQRDGFNPLGKLFKRGEFANLTHKLAAAERIHREAGESLALLIRLREFDLKPSDSGQYGVVAEARDPQKSRINQFNISLRPPDYKPSEATDLLTNTTPHVGHDPLQPDREALGRIARRILLESQPVTGTPSQAAEIAA